MDSCADPKPLTEEDKRVAQLHRDRTKRLSDFMSEGGVDVNGFLEKFPEARVVWFRNLGGDKKSEIEKPRENLPTGNSYYEQFDHAIIFNRQAANDFAVEIKEGLKYDGWDKYYICADEEIADYLVAQVSI